MKRKIELNILENITLENMIEDFDDQALSCECRKEIALKCQLWYSMISMKGQLSGCCQSQPGQGKAAKRGRPRKQISDQPEVDQKPKE